MSVKTKKYFIIVLISVYAAYVFHSLAGGAISWAWPNLRTNLHIANSRLGYISSTIALFTVITCLLLNRIFPNVRITNKVMAGVFLQVFALIGTVLSKSFLQIFLFAIPLGIGSGILEVVLNAYSSTHFTAKYTNYLHLFHSMGGIFGPYMMSFALSSNGTWQRGYIFFIIVEIAITLYVIISIPKWDKIPMVLNDKKEKKHISFARLFKMRTLRITLIYTMLLNAVEYIVATWLCTFLVDAKSLSESNAAQKCVILTVGLCLGRFLSGLLSDKIKTWNRIRLSTVILMVGILVFILPIPIWSTFVIMFLMGLGIGPLYSNLLVLTPFNFDEEIVESVVGIEVAFAYIGYFLTGLVFGNLYDKFGSSTFQISLLALIFVSALVLYFLIRVIKKDGRYNETI